MPGWIPIYADYTLFNLPYQNNALEYVPGLGVRSALQQRNGTYLQVMKLKEAYITVYLFKHSHTCKTFYNTEDSLCL